MDLFQVTRIILLSVTSFVVALAWTPILLRILRRYQMGKQIEKTNAPIFNKLHAGKEGTPTMGGIVVWGTVLLATLGIWIVGEIFGGFWSDLNFLTRSETLLPLGALVASALVGLVDDVLGVMKIGPRGGGLRIREKLLVYTAVAAFGAWWFFVKLDWHVLHIPFMDTIDIGLWYIPVFIFVIVATAFSTNEADGLDGLAGGTLLVAFTVMGAVAFKQGRVDLAVFCGVIAGSLLAFLWHNIYPARFFLGDTGSMGLGVVLGIIAMLTNTALLLPLIAFIFVLESGSVIVQKTYKALFGRKLFISTPIHHHFEALGWHESRITMRFWIISAVMASLGLIIALLQ